MPSFKRIIINGPQFFEEVVKPNFGDLVPGANYSAGLLGEFTVLDDVADSRKLVDITPLQNILKRRDASCEIIFSKIGKGGVRKVFVDDLYAATKFCNQEFYQGALKDWRNGDKVFVSRMLGFFRGAVARDVVSNMYFGDVSRAEAANAVWSTNKFDGILTHYQRYIAAGAIPGAQTFNVPNGTITAANAKVYLENLYSKRPVLLATALPTDQAIQIDRAWADAYEEYLTGTGTGDSATANVIQNGIKVRAYKGIPIQVNEFFGPVLQQITGQVAHFGVLTFRGNFVFATDKNYGTGINGDQALRVWYSEDEDTLKYVNVLKGGTEIGAPELTVLALPS